MDVPLNLCVSKCFSWSASKNRHQLKISVLTCCFLKCRSISRKKLTRFLAKVNFFQTNYYKGNLEAKPACEAINLRVWEARSDILLFSVARTGTCRKLHIFLRRTIPTSVNPSPPHHNPSRHVRITDLCLTIRIASVPIRLGHPRT